MPYVRKTRDTWELHVQYGQGWEHELTEDSRREARARRAEYRANCPQYPTRIVYRRERIEPAAHTHECAQCGHAWTCHDNEQKCDESCPNPNGCSREGE